MARLFISYKREEQQYAFALRQWLMDSQGWASDDIFVDVGHLHAGEKWEDKLLAEAEGAEVLLFIASELSLQITSFCYRELQHAKGQILAVTIGSITPQNELLQRAIPDRAKSRQIAALDKEPTQPFAFVSPKDNTNSSAQLNAEQVESIGRILRELGVAPNSFRWTPTPQGPYPGLRPLMEGDEAIFCGREIEIRDGLTALEQLRASATQRILLIEAPSGAGKSSFLRAGLWGRLRRHAGFTPLAIIRAAKGAVRNEEWGLVSGLYDTLTRSDKLGKKLGLARNDLERRASRDLVGLLRDFADADASQAGRRTLLLGIDQAEEMSALSTSEERELDGLLRTYLDNTHGLDCRLVMTVRDDSVDATLERLERLRPQRAEQVPAIREPPAQPPWHQLLRLHRLPVTKLDDIIVEPAKAAARAGWPLRLEQEQVNALVAAVAGGDTSDALPILALALQRMVTKLRAPDGRIKLTDNEAAQFIESSVSQAAAEALEIARAKPDDLRRLVIPCLATWDPRAGVEGAAKRQVASEDVLFSGDRVHLRTLANALVDQRLLLRAKAGSGATYEVAHEALLRVPPLGDLIFARREKFELARILDGEAKAWIASDRRKDRLGRSGERLREALALVADSDFGPDLAQVRSSVGEYLKRCEAHEKEEDERQRRIIGRAFVKPALQALQDGQLEHALRQSAAGAVLAQDIDFHLLPELWSAAASAIFERRTERVIRGHSRAVLVAAVSPCGSRIVTGSSDNTACIWDSASGALVANLVDESLGKQRRAHAGAVVGASFDAQGQRVLTFSHDATARIWNAVDGTLLMVLAAHEGPLRDAAFSPDGTQVVTVSDDGTARLWDIVAGRALGSLPASQPFLAASFSPDGRTVVACAGPTTYVWEPASGNGPRELTGQGGVVTAVAFSPNGKRIVTASHSGARLWRVDEADEGQALSGAEIKSIAYSPTGRAIVTSHDDASAIRGHSAAINSIAFSPDGRMIVTSSDDASAIIWSVDEASQLRKLQGHRGSVHAACFSPDGKRVATASSDGTIRIWNAETGEAVDTLHGHEKRANTALFLPDGYRVLSASDDATLRIWRTGIDSLTYQHVVSYGAFISAHAVLLLRFMANPVLWNLETNADSGEGCENSEDITALAVSRESRLVLLGFRSGKVNLWVDRYTPAPDLRGHTGRINGASFSRDGRQVVTASDDRTARVWATDTGACIATLEGHFEPVRCVVLSPDGRRVITGSGGYVRIWDPAHVDRRGGSPRSVEIWHIIQGSDVLDLSCNRNGRDLVAAFADGAMRIWNFESRTLLAEVRARTSGGIRRAMFSPDGGRIATAHSDGTARIWDWNGKLPREIACLAGHTKPIDCAVFSPDGLSLLTICEEGKAKVWDIARTEAIAGEPGIVLAAGLSGGLGLRTAQEATDLLMQDAPEDLHQAALELIGSRAGRVADVEALLGRAPNEKIWGFRERASRSVLAPVPAPVAAPLAPEVLTDPEQVDASAADAEASAAADRLQRWRVIAAASIAAAVLVGAIVLVLNTTELLGYQSWLAEMRARR